MKASTLARGDRVTWSGYGRIHCGVVCFVGPDHVTVSSDTGVEWRFSIEKAATELRLCRTDTPAGQVAP